ncbi:MAG: hypothetical protein WBM78_22245 [Desulfobacterales bacterium]
MSGHQVQCRSRSGYRSDRGDEGDRNVRQSRSKSPRDDKAFGFACVYKRIASGSQTAIGYSMQVFGRNQFSGQVSGFRIRGLLTPGT